MGKEKPAAPEYPDVLYVQLYSDIYSHIPRSWRGHEKPREGRFQMYVRVGAIQHWENKLGLKEEVAP